MTPFEDYWRSRNGRPNVEHIARAAWDAATAAAEERLDIARVSMATYLAVRDERDALRQRIAELEGEHRPN